MNVHTVLIGAGGHAKVVYEAMIHAGYAETEVTLRADRTQNFMGRSVVSPEFPENMHGLHAHVAIGDNSVRARLLRAAVKRGATLLRVIHPGAKLSPSTTIADGSFIACGAILAASVTVGTGVIVNHGSIIDHDCRIDHNTHIAPGAVMGGGVSIGQNVLLGANATILPGLDIGNDVLIGAGSVVTKSIASGSSWIGTSCVPKEN
ncbi:MAG: NeuD/PglB/VioB family sugar acetyltransferase [Hyphomicrobiales bacterium]|uniref:NeuD/PglB/VioB family sugar acetyltransferase n=1 Tax=Roseibium polysiphoniae TaxID=2571221 RepID=UPI0032971A85